MCMKIRNCFDREHVRDIRLPPRKYDGTVEDGILTIKAGRARYLAIADITDGYVRVHVEGDWVSLHYDEDVRARARENERLNALFQEG